MQPNLVDLFGSWLDGVGPGDYVGIHAWIEPRPEYRSILEACRLDVRDTRRVATTLDFGPRFLHSTGQLHKGGPNTGRFLQIIDHPRGELPVPETDYTFGELIGAQSLGDNQALLSRDRSVVLVCLGEGGQAALETVAAALSDAAKE